MDLMETLQAIVGEAAAHFWTPPGTTLTCCVLVLPGGFTILGKSACMDQTQFDADMGRKLAFDDACNELLKLEMYKQATSGPRIELASAADVAQVKRVNGHG